MKRDLKFLRDSVSKMKQDLLGFRSLRGYYVLAHKSLLRASRLSPPAPPPTSIPPPAPSFSREFRSASLPSALVYPSNSWALYTESITTVNSVTAPYIYPLFCPTQISTLSTHDGEVQPPPERDPPPPHASDFCTLLSTPAAVFAAATAAASLSGSCLEALGHASFNCALQATARQVYTLSA